MRGKGPAYKYGPKMRPRRADEKEITTKKGREERPERKAIVEYTGCPAKKLQNS